MPREQLPAIRSSQRKSTGEKHGTSSSPGTPGTAATAGTAGPAWTGHRSITAAKPAFLPPAAQRRHQAARRRLNRQQPSSSSSSSSPASRPRPGPSSILLSDNTVTPWGGLALSESSFTTITPILPAGQPPLPSPPPPSPQATPSTPHPGKEEEDEASEGFNRANTSSPPELHQKCTDVEERGPQMKRTVLPQRWRPLPPRLPPLRPVTNLSFSRSFTFSFFELPLHHSPRCRAEHIKNLFQLLKHY